MNAIFVADQMEDILSDPIYLERPKQLFGKFWYENEIGLLMGDTNVGKTALAYDIAFANDTGFCYWHEPMSEVVDDVNSVYYDLENSKRQFAARYVRKGFTLKNMTRVEYDQRNVQEVSWKNLLIDLENRIDDKRPNHFYIDNLSYLLNSSSAKESIEFMRQLKALKERHQNLSILIVAHTKKRNLSKPLEQNDLYGSKLLINFVDSAFALSGSVKDTSTRYLKQIKTRSSKKLDQVAELEIEGEPYLHFEFVGWTDEEEHLKQGSSRSTLITDAIVEQILSLSADGFSIREIAKVTGISKSSVQRALKG